MPMVAWVHPLKVGQEVKERISVNVQEKGVTKGEAEFRESWVGSALTTRSRASILTHVFRPQLAQRCPVSG